MKRRAILSTGPGKMVALAVAGVAVLGGLTMAARAVWATPSHAVPPQIGTPLSRITPLPDANAPRLPGIDDRVLGQFGVVMESPDGRGEVKLGSMQARAVALPLGEGVASGGWRIIAGPTLAWVDHRVTASRTDTCLCWAIELEAPHSIPCEVDRYDATSAPALCDNRHLVEFVDAASGARWLSISGHGLG